MSVSPKDESFRELFRTKNDKELIRKNKVWKLATVLAACHHSVDYETLQASERLGFNSSRSH